MVSVDRQEMESLVKDVYKKVATAPHGKYHFEMGLGLARKLGYPPDLLGRIPEEAIESFAGVGYHFDLADLKPGERVLDLGSGSGMDAFAAALRVGPSGAVAGVDMTREQLDKADRLRNGLGHVVFHEGHIEALPFGDKSFEVVISNGVINLVADKAQAFREVARVLRPSGRMAISDIVTEKQLSEGIVCDATLWAACIGGAMQRDRYRAAIEEAGMRIVMERENREYEFLSESAREATDEFGVKSISLLAVKQ